MAPSVELDRLGQVHVLLGVAGFEGCRGLLLQRIQIVDISHMMLTVMELHQSLRNYRLETIHCVWQRLLDGLLKGSKATKLHHEWRP